MRYDSYSRFLKSQMYKDCIVNEMSGKPLIPTDAKSVSKSNGLVKDFISKAKAAAEGPVTNGESEGFKNSGVNSNNPSASANLAAAVQIAASTGNAVLTQSPALDSPTSPCIPSGSQQSGDSPNKKEKKKTMSTILPWTKGNKN